METELQYALNPLAILPRGNVDALNVTCNTADSWACSRNRFFKENLRTGFNRLQESMDRLLEQYNRESVRKMMLKQEEIFKEQVQELHRLYRVQKILMTELSSSKELKPAPLTNAAPGAIHIGSDCIDMETRTGCWRTATSSQTSHSPYSNTHPPTTHRFHTNFGCNFHQSFNVRSDPSSHKLSSCSGNALRIHRGFDLERPAEKENSAEFSAVEDRTSFFKGMSKDKLEIDGPQDIHLCPDGENDIELTLSIGHSTYKKKLKHRPHSNLKIGCSESTPDETRQLIPSTSVRLDREEESSDASAGNFNRQNLKRSHCFSKH